MEKRFTYQFTWNLLVWLNAIWFFTGLFVFKWEPVFIILAYVFETIVIGFIAVAKMLLILIFSDAQKRETQTLLLKRKESNYPNNDVTANQKGWATALFGFFVMSMFGIVFFVFILMYFEFSDIILNVYCASDKKFTVYRLLFILKAKFIYCFDYFRYYFLF